VPSNGKPCAAPRHRPRIQSGGHGRKRCRSSLIYSAVMAAVVRACSAPIGVLLLKGDPDRVRVPGTAETPADRPRHNRIRCPRCGWEPGANDLWMCTCLHTWNTFDTRGVCPSCGRKWTDTQCLRCAEWSPHDDWYDDE